MTLDRHSRSRRLSPIRRARESGARAESGLEPGRWILQPGHLTWRALV